MHREAQNPLNAIEKQHFPLLYAILFQNSDNPTLEIGWFFSSPRKRRDVRKIKYRTYFNQRAFSANVWIMLPNLKQNGCRSKFIYFLSIMEKTPIKRKTILLY